MSLLNRIRVASANVRNNPVMSRAKVREDYLDVRDDGADIVGWQEIGVRRAYYKALLLALFRGPWRHVFMRYPTPISYRSDRYELLDKGVVVLSKGRIGVNPTRRMMWVKLRRKSDGQVLIFSNRHYVNGAWNDKPKSGKAWRKQAWLIGYAEDQEWQRGWHAKGLLHIGVGDLNRVNVPLYLPTQIIASNGVGYDKVLLDDPEGRVRRHRLVRDELNSDHDALVFTALVADPRPPRQANENLTITQRVVRNARERGVTILDHDEWGSVARRVYAQRRDEKPVTALRADTLVAHITVTIDSGPLTGDFAKDMRTVERIGLERFGSGVSYNFVLDMSEGMVGVGQPLDAKGTHTVNDKNVAGFSYDQNAVARAIASLGMERTPLSRKAAHAYVQLVAAMVEEDALTDGFDFCPHSMFAWKDCPCDSTRDRMGDIRRRALAAVAA